MPSTAFDRCSAWSLLGQSAVAVQCDTVARRSTVFLPINTLHVKQRQEHSSLLDCRRLFGLYKFLFITRSTADPQHLLLLLCSAAE